MKKVLVSLKGRVLLSSLALLLFASCHKDHVDSPIIEEVVNLNGFTKIYAGERFNVIITKGNNFSIKLKGPANDVHDMELGVANSILDIQYAHHQNDRPRVDVIISLPTLVSVALAGAGTGEVNGFQDQPIVTRAVLSGASKLKINGASINMQVDITGASQLDINGTTASLFGTVSGAGKLNAYDMPATEVDIDVSGGSEARVKVVQILFAAASGGSRIYYKGNPGAKHIETSGGAQVIQE